MGLSQSVEVVRRRYDRLARIVPLLEVAFLQPLGIRDAAAERLELQLGDRVLDVGCGSGRNLPHLVRRVGPTGAIVGVDASSGMLARARRECERHAWSVVQLIQQDASELDVRGRFNGVLFSLSYSVLSQPRRTLAQTWAQLAPGGHLVIMDATLPPGLVGRLLETPALLASRATVLGDPRLRPWEDLAQLTGGPVQTERFHLGTYFISRARKPHRTGLHAA